MPRESCGEPVGGDVTCTCFVGNEITGSFAKPDAAQPNFCVGMEADDLAVSECGWAPGVIPPAPEG